MAEDGMGGADSAPEGDTGSSFDMNGALDTISADLFGSESETAEPELDAEPEATEPEPEVAEPEPTEPTARPAPQSWKKEMHEKYAALPPDVQAYIVEREEQMRAGLEKDRGDANLGRTMRDVMTPYRAHFQAAGIEEPVAVARLLDAHYRLATGDPATKQAMFAQLAQSYGVEIGAQPAGEQTPTDPAIQALRAELNGIKTHLTAAQQRTMQEAKERVTRDVDAFASSPDHPYFDEVSSEIVAFLQAGHELQDAYEKAVWANPVTRAKEVARLQQEQEKTIREKATAEAEAARKAAGNTVRNRDTRRVPTEPKGSMRDLDSSLRDTLREIKSRTH